MGYNKIPLALGFNDSTGNASGLIEFQLNLSDVGDTCNLPAETGQALVYNEEGQWCPSTLPAPGEFTGNLSDVGQVCNATPSDGQVLAWSGTANVWCASTIPTGGGGGGYTPPLSPSIGDLIVDDATGDFQGKIGSATFFTQGIADNDILSLAFDAGEEQILKWNGTSLESGRLDQLVIEVRANTGVTISKGDAVYVTGFHSNNRVYVERAQANNPATMPAIGLASTDISEDTNGLVVSFGKTLVGDNSSFVGNIGDTVYVSETTPGALTTTHPAGPDDLIQNIGFLAKKDSTNGIIKVTGVGRANDIPNTITLGDTTLTPTDAKLDGTTASELVITDANNKIASVASSTLLTDYYTKSQADIEFIEDSDGSVKPTNLLSTLNTNQIPYATNTTTFASITTNADSRAFMSTNANIGDLTDVTPTDSAAVADILQLRGSTWSAVSLSEAEAYAVAQGDAAIGGGSTASPEVIFKGVGYPVASGNSTSYTNFVSSVIPASVLSNNEDIEIDVRGRILAAGTNISWKFSLNGTSYLETGTGQSTNDTRYHMRIYVSKLETNRQMIVSEYIQLAGNAQTQGVGRWESIDREGGLHNEATETETNDLTVELDWRNNSTNTAQIGTVDSYVIKRIPTPAF
jgi:hypothetical protein